MNCTNTENVRVAFHTLGCKVNQYETEAIKEGFLKEGFLCVGERDEAEVYIINTCSVTHLADRKSRQYIRRMKRQYPDSIVLVTGCYAQVNPEDLEKIQEVDIIVGTNEKHNIVKRTREALVEKSGGKLEKSTMVHHYRELTEFIDFGMVESMENKTRAYIKIQEGCNRFCSYCIIPYARGPVRSRAFEDIIREAEGLIKKGYKEIVLTGINTALCDSLDKVLDTLNNMDGEFRIRLSSLEPNVVNKDFVKNLLKYNKLCRHLHLSVQAGSNHVLKMMNRTYTREKYMEIVEMLKEFDSLYGITTDIIVGFPNETEDDFEESIDLVDKVEFAKIHPFTYSKRKGTPAATMDGQVDSIEKSRRMDRLLEAAEQNLEKFIAKNIDTSNKVIFEEVDYKTNMVKGYTDNYIRAYYPISQENLDEFENHIIGKRIVDVILKKHFEDGVIVDII